MKNYSILILLIYMKISLADTIPSQVQTFNIKIRALNLTEDAFTGATYNDEVFFIGYHHNGMNYPAPFLSKYFVLDTNVRTKIFKATTDTILPNDTITIFIVEKDSEKQLKGIEPTCRMYINDIVTESLRTDSSSYYPYFDEDDVIGIWRIFGKDFDLSEPIVKYFEGVNLFDWFKYKVEIYKP